MSKNVIYMQEALREIKEIKNKIAALKPIRNSIGFLCFCDILK